MQVAEFNQFIIVTYKVGNENATERHLFVKQHDGDNDIKKPANRTLFVLNVPQYLNKKCFKFLYGQCGEIERIFMHKKPKGKSDDHDKKSSSMFLKEKPCGGYKVAYVVFKEPSSLSKALKCDELPAVPLKKLNTSIGLNKWVQEYNSNFIDCSSVQKEIDTFMADYDEKREEEKQRAKDMDVDEDGWVTITKHSKKPKISRKESVSKRIIEKQKKESEKKMLLNFYRCQLRDKKMEEILELRKKFEKDKKRIAMMKENRKFKPL